MQGERNQSTLKKKLTDYEKADACKESVTKAACEELADFPNLCTLTACQQLVKHVSSCRNIQTCCTEYEYTADML